MKGLKLKPIVWKSNNDGGEVAWCGSIKIGWVKRSLSKKDIFYPTILKDTVKTKNPECSSLEEGKHVVETVFKQVMNLMQEENEE